MQGSYGGLNCYCAPREFIGILQELHRHHPFQCLVVGGHVLHCLRLRGLFPVRLVDYLFFDLLSPLFHLFRLFFSCRLFIMHRRWEHLQPEMHLLLFHVCALLLRVLIFLSFLVQTHKMFELVARRLPWIQYLSFYELNQLKVKMLLFKACLWQERILFHQLNMKLRRLGYQIHFLLYKTIL